MIKKILKKFITRKQVEGFKNFVNTVLSFIILFFSKFTNRKLYRNLGYNYHIPDNGMGSFKPYLQLVINNIEISKDIIEVGIGNNSTPIFVNYVNNVDGLNSYHFENNPEWFNKLSSKYQNEKSTFILFNGTDPRSSFDENNIDQKQFSIGFVDSSPWESRTIAINYLKNICDILVIHDSAYFPENNIWGTEVKKTKFLPNSKYWYGKIDKNKAGKSDYSNEFKYWIEIYPIYPGHFSGPTTLITSETIDIANQIKNDLTEEVFYSN
jgi:hypothetical protein